MRRIIGVVAGFLLFTSCDITVKTDNKSKTDSLLQKADTTLEKLGDSAKEKFKDAKKEVKEEWKEHFDKDSTKSLR